MRDVILSLNGIRLRDVEGGLDAWVRLFAAFASCPRNLAVVRRIDGGDVISAVAPPSKSSIAARGHRNDDGVDRSAASAVHDIKTAHTAALRRRETERRHPCRSSLPLQQRLTPPSRSTSNANAIAVAALTSLKR